MVDPFTGSSSYRSAEAQQRNIDVRFQPPTTTNSNTGSTTSSQRVPVKHFPLSKYMAFSTCDPAKVLIKIRFYFLISFCVRNYYLIFFLQRIQYKLKR